MNKTNSKQVFILIGISTILVCATFISSYKTFDNAEPSSDIKNLDAKLLTDLQNQEIVIDEKTKCLMECNQMSEAQLRSLFAIENVNYEKCEKGNCHLTSYTIEAKTDDGKQISFKIDSGEEGNEVRDMQVKNNDCDCI